MAATADPGTTIRLFLSSTFVDLGREREVLQHHVFPLLRQQCAAQGFRFQPIDLRWGVSAAAGAERQTLRICFAELARCRRLSPDLFQLILLGERYGSCFLPEQFPVAQVERLWPHLSAVDRETFKRAYFRDENAVPAEYVMLPAARGLPSAGEDDLRLALAQAGRTAGFTVDELLPFTGSATHLEIQQGLLDRQASDPRGVLAAICGSAPASALQEDQRQQAMREAVIGALPADQVLHYSAPPRPEDTPAADETADAALAQQFLAFLAPRLQAVMVAREQDRQGRDLVAVANATFAAQRAERVVGREAELARIADYLVGDTPLPLVVTGAPGCGKSTLLAEVAKRLAATTPNTVVVARYIGITPGTSSLADLVGSLRREIAARYGQPTPELVTDLSQLIATLAQALQTLAIPATHPLILLVDALDQLGTQAQRVDWLPRTLAPHVRLVVSVLPDRQELADLRMWLPEEQVLTVGPLGREAGQQVLRHWLVEDARTLTPAQESAVLAAFVAAGGSPLYLRLAEEAARHWHSEEPVPMLPPTTRELLAARLDALETPAQFGETLVRHALGDLAAARDGLAEDELLDVLARDRDMPEALHILSPNSPAIDPSLPLPVVLWARLHAELERLLTEREADGTRLFTFYHGQVRQVVEQRSLQGSDGRARHRDLADYFGSQPWRFAAGVWNARKLVELASQQAGSGAVATLTETLTDARYLQGTLTIEGANATLADLALASQPMEAGAATTVDAGKAEALRDINWVVGAWAGFLEQHPEEVANQIEGRRTGTRVLHHVPGETGHPALRLLHPSLPGDPSLLRVFTGHTGEVNDCAVSPDRQFVLSAASQDQILRLWDVASAQTVLTFTGHTSSVETCAFSPDGRAALSASFDRTLRLWDVTTGECKRVFSGHSDAVWDCAFSPDGRFALSASSDRTLRLWDVASAQTVQVLTGHSGIVTSCAFSPDGRLVLSASLWDRTFRLWEVQSGRPLRTLRSRGVNCCTFSLDGRFALTAHTSHILRLWDVKSWKCLRTFRGHTEEVLGCVFSPDGHFILSASSDRTLRLWDVATGQTVRIFTGHRDAVRICAFTEDGRLALSGSKDKTLRLWDVGSGKSPRMVQSSVHTDLVTSCAFSPDGRLALSGSRDKTLRLWDVASGRELRTLRGHTEEVTGCAFSPEGRFALSASRDHTLRLWEVQSGKRVRTFRGHRDDVLSCAFSPDGRLALSTSDEQLRLWDVKSGKTLRVIRSHTDLVQSCAFSPDGRLALSAGVNAPGGIFVMRLWDLASGRELRTFRGHTKSVISCAFSSDGRRALSASWDSTMRLWDVASGQTVRTFEDHSGTVDSCAVSPDGRLALSTGVETLRVWDIAGGTELTCWTTTEALNCCAFGPTGRYVVAGDYSGGVHFLELIGIDSGGSVPHIPHASPAAAGRTAEGKAGETTVKQPGWWPFRRR